MTRPRGGYGAPRRNQPGQPARGPRVNRFDAPCASCAETVRAGTGTLEGYQGHWVVKHRHQEWSGSPVSGWYVGGCPADTAKLNAQGGWGPQSVRVHVAPPAQVDPSDAREASRLAGGRYAYTASGARMTMASARCEDAPCCGCCD